MVSVLHRVSRSKRTYADINTITRVPHGVRVPEQILPSLKYDIENGADGVFKQLPKFVQEKIQTAHEWQAESAQDKNNGHDEAAEEPDEPYPHEGSNDEL